MALDFITNLDVRDISLEQLVIDDIVAVDIRELLQGCPGSGVTR